MWRVKDHSRPALVAAVRFRSKRPILLPVSRKTLIGDVLELENPLDRDAGTIACAVAGMMRGAAILRVHNVAATVNAVRVIDPLLSNRE